VSDVSQEWESPAQDKEDQDADRFLALRELFHSIYIFSNSFYCPCLTMFSSKFMALVLAVASMTATAAPTGGMNGN